MSRVRHGRVRVGSLAVVLVTAVVLGGCGDDDGGGDATAGLPEVDDSEFVDMTGKDTVTVDAKDNTFGPQYVTVSPGTKVVFDNRGRNPHNVISVEPDAFEDVPTDQLQPGDTAEVVFDDEGEFPYYCSLHATPSKGMTGRIRVAP